MFNPPDILDQASLETERFINDALAKRVQYVGVSAQTCEDCDGEIPEGRRIAVPGVQFCADCQGLIEQRSKRA